MKRFAIIVAGGKGLRMGTDIPKQFLDLAGKPVLVRTLEAFHQFDDAIRIILVLPEAHFALWDQLKNEFAPDMPVKVVAGGETRFHSVSNGLKAIEEEGLVAVHDAVRPLVDQEIMANAYLQAEAYGAAIAVVNLKESIREISGKQSSAVPRDNYRLVQTPQVFKTELIKSAYAQKYKDEFTDDASVVENLGHHVYLVQGSYLNIKITTPEDLRLAASYFQDTSI